MNNGMQYTKNISEKLFNKQCKSNKIRPQEIIKKLICHNEVHFVVELSP